MKRNPKALAAEQFDVLVVGGGAFGAAAAWDASLRGLRVALIEQSDFGGGASAECFKMVHGGIRYLQHADLRRMRFSCAQRSAMLRIAPHLVNPLPIVIPTYGHGRQGKAFLAAGMLAYDMLTAGRNLGVRDPSRRIRGMELLSKNRVLELFPELDARSLTGGAVFEDGQMYNAARLVLAFVKSAVKRGAVAANYVQAQRFLWAGRRVVGMRARDALDGEEFDIRASLVLNAAGPWADYLLEDTERFPGHRRGHFSRDACFLVNRRPTSKYALAVPGWSKDSDAVVSRAARHLFAVPWRDCMLIGVWHRLFPARPDTAEVEEGELAAWIEEMNSSYPALRLSRDDVIYANCGLVPFGDGKTSAGELSFGKESRFIDHRNQGIDGLVTLIGIRYTTARGDAATAVDLLAALEYLQVAERAQAPGMSERLGRSDTLMAEVSFAARDEMAQRLADVVLRRTDLGSGSHPGTDALKGAAIGMQRELGWSDSRREAEVADTERALRHHRAAQPANP